MDFADETSLCWEGNSFSSNGPFLLGSQNSENNILTTESCGNYWHSGL